MSKLTANIFAKLLIFPLLSFYSEQLELSPMGIYEYLEFCHQSLLCEARQVNHSEQHYSFL